MENMEICFNCDNIVQRSVYWSEQFQKIFVDFNYTSIENNCNWCKQYNMSLDLVKRKYKCKHFKEKSIEKKKQDEQDEDYY